MGRYVTQFGSTVNVPDEDVDTYRSNGFLADDAEESKATTKATSRRSAKRSDEK